MDLQQSQKLPDTCPTSSSQLTNTQNSQPLQDQAPWGYIFPNRPKIHWAALYESEYLVGRSPKCQVILGDEIDPKLRCQFSKEHFRIRRAPLNSTSDLKVVHIDDLSFNGTFINGKRLGKGKSAILRNNDRISLALSSFDAFVYMDFETDFEIRNYPKEVRNTYAISRKLGSGAFGDVRLVFEKGSGQGYAMKVIQKNKFLLPERISPIQPIRVQREINILKRLRHPFVIKFHDVQDHPNMVFLIVELVQGGELFNKVQKRALKEPQAKYFFYQLALAVRYLHRQGIIHRDIKLENILLTCDADPMIKLVDFGLSNFVDSESMIKTYCGTPLYIAPEVLQSEGRMGTYDTQADVWSMGIVLYMCLSGMSPFSTDDSKIPLNNQILAGYYSFPRKYWKMVSHNAVHLIKRMLVVDPKRRITIDQILQHPWLQDKEMILRVGRLLGPNSGMEKENVILEDIEEEMSEIEDESYNPKSKKARLEEETESLHSSLYQTALE